MLTHLLKLGRSYTIRFLLHSKVEIIKEILTFSIPVLFDIPYGVILADDLVGNYLVLVEAPVSELAAAEFKGQPSVNVDQVYQGLDGAPLSTLVLSVDYVHAPQVLGRHRHVVVDVAGHFLKKNKSNLIDPIRISWVDCFKTHYLKDRSLG